MAIPKNILVPVDFSEHSDEALGHAVEFARQFKARVHVLHVVESRMVQCIDDYCLRDELVREIGADKVAQFTTDYSLSEQLMKRIADEMFASSREKIRTLVAKVPGAGHVEITTNIRRGHPHEEILKEQEERSVDLIIMPTHGRGGLQKLYLGSTAEQVVRHAACSVTVIRT